MNEHPANSANPRRTLFWGLGGAYLAYLGYDLLHTYFSGQVTSRQEILLCILAGSFFVLMGVAVVVLAIRQGVKLRKAQVEAEKLASAQLEDPSEDQDPQA